MLAWSFHGADQTTTGQERFAVDLVPSCDAASVMATNLLQAAHKGLLSAPVGIILGIVSLVQIKNDPAQNTGKPLSIIGVALSAAYILIWLVIFLIYGFAIFMGSLGNH